ncbi:unnamed protein product [Polarella glacialis]|uniref:Calmodulin n=1 Tax=Polarella glacialis TaxID=89957 RepID=A0A813FGE3_POLGL|nr:unnamed protein product [Polarella glacialis]CAE8647085.1 unnamed protein product [Polarella glacialis]
MGKQNEQEGFIDFQTFLTLMARKIKENDTEEELIEAFKVFDKNCDGFITAGELKLSMNGRGERLDDTEVDEMIHEADLDSDGQINYDEFAKLLFGVHVLPVKSSKPLLVGLNSSVMYRFGLSLCGKLVACLVAVQLTAVG